jgi:hypothetical protein
MPATSAADTRTLSERVNRYLVQPFAVSDPTVTPARGRHARISPMIALGHDRSRRNVVAQHHHLPRCGHPVQWVYRLRLADALTTGRVGWVSADGCHERVVPAAHLTA